MFPDLLPHLTMALNLTEIALLLPSHASRPPPIHPPPHTGLFLGSGILLILITSSSFNAFTLLVFARNRLLHTSNNCLIAGLAAADLLYALTACLSSLAGLVAGPLSAPLCRPLGYLIHLTSAAATNTAALISFHRFVSIVVPQRRIMGTVRAARRAVGAVWVGTALSGLPTALTPAAYTYSPVLTTCTQLTGRPDVTQALYTFLLNFLLPFVLMLSFYTRIYRTVLKHRVSTISELSHSHAIERKTKYLMVAVLTVLVAGWLPYHTALVLGAASGTPAPPRALAAVWVVTLLTAVIHPLLYAVCNRLYCRCMLRHLKCKGPLKRRFNARFPHQASLLSSDDKADADEVSTLGPLPDPATLPRAFMISSGTQTSRLSLEQNAGRGPAGQAGGAEPGYDRGSAGYLGVRQGRKPSTCSHYTDVSAAYSSRSSVPTVMRFPYKSTHQRNSQISQYVMGPTPTDSGRSSFASGYVPTTPGCYSNRTSISSQFPKTSRTSMTSMFPPSIYTPHGTDGDDSTPAPFRGKRQASLYSHSSYSSNPASRNSFSSRFSHYAPFSARSSISSLFMMTSPCDTLLPGTPMDQDDEIPDASANLDGDYVHLPPPLDAYDAPRGMRRFSYNRQTVSSWIGTASQGRLSHLQVPLSDIEDLETNSSSPENPTDSPMRAPSVTRTPRRSPVPDGDDDESTRQRVSVYMFGDIEPDEASELIDVEKELEQDDDDVLDKIEEQRKTSGPSREPWDESRKSQLEMEVRGGTRKVSTSVPKMRPSSRNIMLVTPSPTASPRSSTGDSSGGYSNRGTNEERLLDQIPEVCSIHHSVEDLREEMPFPKKLCIIDSIDKVVSVVVKAKKLCARAVVEPLKPDTPIPDDLEQRVAPRERVRSAREQSRYVYERAVPPPAYYTCGGGGRGEGKKPMTHLRVPGRPPPLKVPQTIFEEDVPTELLGPGTPRAETPAHRRRKNASSWIAPPVIDMPSGQDDRGMDMKVECPGVLVEHHN